MRFICRFLSIAACVALPLLPLYANGPHLGKNGGIGDSTSVYVNGEPTGGTYSINGTTGVVTANGVKTPVVVLTPGTVPTSPVNGQMWTTSSGVYAQINGVTVGPLGSTTGSTNFSSPQTFSAGLTASSVVIPPNTPPSSPTNGQVWTTSSGVYTQINGASSLFVINNQLATGGWYASDSTPANFNRLNDRVLIGGATLLDGKSAPVSEDWLTAKLVGFGIPVGSTITQASQALIETTDGNGTSHNALVTAAHNSVSNSNAVAVSGYGYCDSTSASAGCWGGYFEGRRLNGTTGPAYGIETDVAASSTSVLPSVVGQGNTVANQIACGGEFPQTGGADCSAAIQVWANPNKFKSGIVFGLNSLESGAAALLVPTGNTISFQDGSGNSAGVINSSSSGAGNGGNINFASGGVVVNSADGSPIGYFANHAGNVNELSFSGGSSGTSPTVGAVGSDTNINLLLSAKGTGGIFGTINGVTQALAGVSTSNTWTQPQISTYTGTPFVASTLIGEGAGADGLTTTTSDLKRYSFTGTKTSTTPYVGQSIEITDASVGPASTSTNTTPQSATYGRVVSLTRPNWNTSTITGELDGDFVSVRQAHGDTTAYGWNVGATSGFAGGLEGVTFSADSTGAPIKEIDTQLGVINSRDGGEIGLNLQSLVGTNLQSGIRMGSNSGSSWLSFMVFTNPSGVLSTVSGSDGSWNGPVNLSPLASGNSQSSFPLQFKSTTSAGATDTASVQEDTTGNLIIKNGQNGASIYTKDNNNNTLTNTSSAGFVSSININGPSLQLQPTAFANLPSCTSGAVGTIAYIYDAASPITAWHQQVTAGGGSNKAFVSCNGTAWYAFSD